MKKIFVAITCVLVFLGCSKDDANPNPDPVVPILPDTLGAGWTKTVLDQSEYFSDIFFADNVVGYAVSNKNIYQSNNGGISWVNTNLHVNNPSNIAVSPDRNLYMANSTDTVYRLNYGSNQLSSIELNAGTFQFYDIFFINNLEAFGCSASRLHGTTDGGASWQQISLNPSGLGIGGNSFVHFIDNQTGWIAGSNQVIRTNGNINTWQVCNVPANTLNGNTLVSIFGSSASVVYMAVGGKILKSINGGINFDWVATLPNDGFYTDLHFVSESIGYASLGGKIYKTVDAGVTWEVVVALGNSGFVEIHFTDANHGWACGSGGALYRFNN